MSADKVVKECEEDMPEKLYPNLNEKATNGKAKFMDTYVEDMALVVKAADFAARRHRFQKRKDVRQTPYVNHCIGKQEFLKFYVLLFQNQQQSFGPSLWLRSLIGLNWICLFSNSNTEFLLISTIKGDFFVGVAHILTSEAKVTDAATVAAAMLHDTVEDTKTTLEELTQEFGAEVSGLVRECTDDKSLSKDKRKQLQVQNASNHSHKVSDVFVLPIKHW